MGYAGESTGLEWDLEMAGISPADARKYLAEADDRARQVVRRSLADAHAKSRPETGVSAVA